MLAGFGRATRASSTRTSVPRARSTSARSSRRPMPSAAARLVDVDRDLAGAPVGAARRPGPDRRPAERRLRPRPRRAPGGSDLARSASRRRTRDRRGSTSKVAIPCSTSAVVDREDPGQVGGVASLISISAEGGIEPTIEYPRRPMSDEQTPPTDESALIAERRAKLDRLRERGLDPFPARLPGPRADRRVRAAHEGLADGEETEARHVVAGRLMARRGHGKAAFLDLRDGTGPIQLHSRADVLGADEHERLLDDVDLGDFIGVEGVAFKLPPRRAQPPGRLLDAAGEEPAPASRQARRPRRRRDALPPSRARPDRQPGGARAVQAARAHDRRDPLVARLATASSRSRRRSSSRSTAARWRGRSRPTTTRSTATSTCGSRPSST